MHPEIGGLVDTTSNYENEADDMLRANPPYVPLDSLPPDPPLPRPAPSDELTGYFLASSSVDLTPELWLVKLLMGGIDSSYDSKDE